MTEVPRGLMERLLEPQPAPPGMNSREIVRRAVEFDDPPRFPYSFMVPLATDFFETGVLEWLERGQRKPESAPEIGDRHYDEWGVGWETTKRWWDHSFHHPLQDLGGLGSYRWPDVAAPERFDWMAPYLQQETPTTGSGRRTSKNSCFWNPFRIGVRRASIPPHGSASTKIFSPIVERAFHDRPESRCHPSV